MLHGLAQWLSRISDSSNKIRNSDLFISRPLQSEFVGLTGTAKSLSGEEDSKRNEKSLHCSQGQYKILHRLRYHDPFAQIRLYIVKSSVTLQSRRRSSIFKCDFRFCLPSGRIYQSEPHTSYTKRIKTKSMLPIQPCYAP
jgi:hypothetical protein